MFGRNRDAEKAKSQKTEDSTKSEDKAGSDALETTVEGEEAEVAVREEANGRDIQTLRKRLRAAHFADIISVLMRSPTHSAMTLQEIRQKFVPAFLANQYVLAHAKPKDGSSSAFPAGLALWARVSDDVDARLTAQSDGPTELGPEEWSSGDHLWVVEVVSHEKLAPVILGQLRQRTFGNKPFKMRVKDNSGQFQVHEVAPNRSESPAEV